jgi:hypothetical protein
VVLVDADFRIVGAGEGGVPRPDIPAAKSYIQDPNTGWHANVARVSGPLDAYGVIASGTAVCPLGHFQL